jgi:type I restriction enzyme, S subunit
MTALFPIPASWAWTTLGEIAEVVGGVTKDTKKQSDPALLEVPYLRVANVQRGYLDLREVTKIRVPESTLTKLRLLPGDVLLNEGGDRDKLGRGWVWEGQISDCIHQNHVFRARLPEDTVLPRFLAYYINDPVRQWFDQHAAQSVNLASISLSTIKQLPVPLPPLDEQHRIVAILEDHVSRLAVADQSILTGLRRALRLRQSIADQMFNSVSGASMERLGSLLAEPLRNGHSARASDTGEGIRTLTLTAVTRSEFTDVNTKHTVADPFRVRDLWLRSGDILVERANTPELVGTSAVYMGPSGWAIYPDLLIRVRINDAATPEYVQLILSTTRLRSYFRQNAKGLAGSMPKIDQDTLLRAELPIPSIEEQDRTVASVNYYRDAIDRLHRELEIARRRSSQFRRSLLAEAFAGRLVPQDPMDEPASVLLERARAERAQQPRARRRRGTARHVPQEETLL